MHKLMTPIDPPGTDDRRWKCNSCRVTGLLSELMKIECKAPHSRSFEELLIGQLNV